MRKTKTKAPPHRNPVATAPILKKGGPHGRSEKARRRANQVALKNGDLL